MQHTNELEDLLDRLTAEYTDRLEKGDMPVAREYLDQVPAAARPGLERCLRALDAGSVRATYRPLGPGVRLGRFEIVREIGRGGMALVFLAQDPSLRRAVALKVLRPGLALERTHVDRFLREGQSMARLKHPGVVQVFDVGESDGFHWIAMEYVEGPSLATVIEALAATPEGSPRVDHLVQAAASPALASSLSFEAACARLLGPAVDGLAAAHAAGIIHRDIKPSNVLIHRDGRAVLADFGLARADGDAALSLTGAPIGTPFYMAPEQANAAERSVDERTDVYGLGATLYELLCQERPFEGATIIEVLDAIRERSPRSLRGVRPDLSLDAESVCRKAMQRDPSLRYASADDLAEDLQRLAAGERTIAGVAEGGPIRRFFASLAVGQRDPHEGYKSSIQLLGLPLLHVAGSARPGQGIPTAKGWIAVGPRAVGGVAIGGMTLGAIAFGGLSCGLFALGGLATGAASIGGAAFGLRPMGGLAVGDVAIGGLAVGRGAIGGKAIGRHVIDGETLPTEESRAFFFRQPPPHGELYRWAIESIDKQRSGLSRSAEGSATLLDQRHGDRAAEIRGH